MANLLDEADALAKAGYWKDGVHYSHRTRKPDRKKKKKKSMKKCAQGFGAGPSFQDFKPNPPRIMPPPQQPNFAPRSFGGAFGGGAPMPKININLPRQAPAPAPAPNTGTGAPSAGPGGQMGQQFMEAIMPLLQQGMQLFQNKVGTPSTGKGAWSPPPGGWPTDDLAPLQKTSGAFDDAFEDFEASTTAGPSADDGAESAGSAGAFEQALKDFEANNPGMDAGGGPPGLDGGYGMSDPGYSIMPRAPAPGGAPSVDMLDPGPAGAPPGALPPDAGMSDPGSSGYVPGGAGAGAPPPADPARRFPGPSGPYTSPISKTKPMSSPGAAAAPAEAAEEAIGPATNRFWRQIQDYETSPGKGAERPARRHKNIPGRLIPRSTGEDIANRRRREGGPMTPEEVEGRANDLLSQGYSPEKVEGWKLRMNAFQSGADVNAFNNYASQTSRDAALGKLPTPTDSPGQVATSPHAGEVAGPSDPTEMAPQLARQPSRPAMGPAGRMPSGMLATDRGSLPRPIVDPRLAGRAALPATPAPPGPPTPQPSAGQQKADYYAGGKPYGPPPATPTTTTSGASSVAAVPRGVTPPGQISPGMPSFTGMQQPDPALAAAPPVTGPGYGQGPTPGPVVPQPQSLAVSPGGNAPVPAAGGGPIPGAKPKMRPKPLNPAAIAAGQGLFRGP